VGVSAVRAGIVSSAALTQESIHLRKDLFEVIPGALRDLALPADQQSQDLSFGLNPHE
jgi:hypothetical protein